MRFFSGGGMKWEQPNLKEMNAMDNAIAGCSNGSVNHEINVLL